MQNAIPDFFTDNQAERTQRRIQPLQQPQGTPIYFEGTVGGMMASNLEPRLQGVLLGEPVSVRPMRIPNSRAMFSSVSSTSAIDYRFVRLAGLLADLVPLRPGIDNVKITTPYSSTASGMRVYGRVNAVFDYHGYEFEHSFWVIDVGLPVEMVIGTDIMARYNLRVGFENGETTIETDDAKKVRELWDMYVTK